MSESVPPPNASRHQLERLLASVSDRCPPRDPPEMVGARGLFSLIDGGAEVYLALGIRAALSVRLGCPGLPAVVLDIYDMGSATGAFAAYHHDMREGNLVDIGQEAEFDGGVLQFWRERYYLSLVPLRPHPGLAKLVPELGRSLSEAIGRDGRLPELVRRLPPAGLDRRRLHYFMGPRLLERHLEIPGGNPLGLGADEHGVLAHYREGILLLLSFAKPTRARRALSWLSGVERLGEHRVAAADCRGGLVAAVLARPGPAAGKLLELVLAGRTEESCRKEKE